MGRKKRDRSHLQMQSFEINKPLKARLKELADRREVTLSALIRDILEQFLEERKY